MNWAYAYSPLFLSEMYKKTRSAAMAVKLQKWADRIAKNQEKSGGWAHGPGGPNALGYLELEVMSNWCLAALGAMKRLGIKVDKECIEKAIAYVRACSSADGGVGYSTRPGQKGMGDPGRTAGAITAFCLLGLRRHPFFPNMCNYFRRELRGIPSGHVSPVMHFTAGALASWHLGKREWSRFMKEFRIHFMTARRPDGSFAAIPTKETELTRSNTDLTLGDCWTTSSYALILSIPEERLSLLTARK